MHADPSVAVLGQVVRRINHPVPVDVDTFTARRIDKQPFAGSPEHAAVAVTARSLVMGHGIAGVAEQRAGGAHWYMIQKINRGTAKGLEHRVAAGNRLACCVGSRKYSRLPRVAVIAESPGLKSIPDNPIVERLFFDLRQ